MRGAFSIIFVICIFCASVKTFAVTKTIDFLDYDNHRVCKLLNGVNFIIDQQPLDDFTVEVKRGFETQNKNFIISCEQKRSLGSLYYSSELAHVTFDTSLSAQESEVIEDTKNLTVMITLTNFDEVMLLSKQAMHDLRFQTSEKINGEHRMSITCQYEAGSYNPKSCTIKLAERR